MKKSFVIFLTTLFVLSLSACNFPQDLLPPTPGAPVQASATAAITLPPTRLPATNTPLPLKPTAAATLLPATASPTWTVEPSVTPTELVDFPQVTFKINANCRLGPSKNYFLSTSFLQGRVTTAEGRNPDGSWLYVKAIERYCWVSISTIQDPVSYTFLPVVSFPPLPDAPTQLVVVNKDCNGRPTIALSWTSVSGETGYNIYRDGITLATLRAEATFYTDYPSFGKEYFYEIEAINPYGLSVRFSRTVTGCQK